MAHGLENSGLFLATNPGAKIVNPQWVDKNAPQMYGQKNWPSFRGSPHGNDYSG